MSNELDNPDYPLFFFLFNNNKTELSERVKGTKTTQEIIHTSHRRVK